MENFLSASTWQRTSLNPCVENVFDADTVAGVGPQASGASGFERCVDDDRPRVLRGDIVGAWRARGELASDPGDRHAAQRDLARAEF